MNYISDDCDEVVLADVIEPLRGCLQLDADGRVDVLETNRQLLLGGHSLDDFRLATAADVPICLEGLTNVEARSKTGVVVLAGGINTRGGGAFGPLRKLGPRTILEHHIHRLQRSVIRDARVLVFCSPLNAASIEHAFRGSVEISGFYRGGLTRRLAEFQPPDGSVVLATDGGWNPTGHFDALRWLVISGSLDLVWDLDILLVHSLTNVGDFYRDANAIIQVVFDSGALAAVEVTPRPLEKRSGSFLVVDRFGSHRLLKYGYGPGHPVVGQADHQLMSTNTWWISLSALKRLLRQVLDDCRSLVRAARNGQRRSEAKELIDTCLPVSPSLSIKRLENQTVIQAERDLDQLSLNPVNLMPIRVHPDRAISMKCDADLKKPGVLEFLSF